MTLMNTTHITTIKGFCHAHYKVKIHATNLCYMHWAVEKAMRQLSVIRIELVNQSLFLQLELRLHKR